MRESPHSERAVTVEASRVKTSTDVALDALGGRWKLAIIGLLARAPRRTSELRRAIRGVSQRMLIAQLRELQRDGLIDRKSFNEIPPRVAYRLTRHGRTTLPIVKTLSRWGARHAGRVYPQRGIEYRTEELRCR
jgi:DNA-binding HxlR family transcriptional regulator